MRGSKLLIRCAAVAFGLAVLAPLSTLAQTISASTGTDPVISTTSPPARESKITVPNHHGNKNSPLLFGRVRNGVYTVDGMVAKLQLNYDVNGVRFVYMFVPGVGTAVLGLSADPDGSSSLVHLGLNNLTFQAGGHDFKLTGVALVNERGNAPEKLYAHLDQAAWNLSRHAMVGFGDKPELPYIWPGAIAPAGTVRTEAENPLAPPVPHSLLPSTRDVVPAAVPTPVAVTPAALHPSSMP